MPKKEIKKLNEDESFKNLINDATF